MVVVGGQLFLFHHGRMGVGVKSRKLESMGGGGSKNLQNVNSSNPLPPADNNDCSLNIKTIFYQHFAYWVTLQAVVFFFFKIIFFESKNSFQ